MRTDWLEHSAPYITAVCATALLAFDATPPDEEIPQYEHEPH